MAEYEVTAKIRLDMTADDPGEAVRKTNAFLKNLLEPKDIELIGAAVTKEKTPVATEDKHKKGAERLLKSLEKELFVERLVAGQPRKRTWRGQSIYEFPLSIMVGNVEAEGKVVEVPKKARKEAFPGDPEKGIASDPGEMFPVAEDHTLYSWSVSAILPEDISSDEAVTVAKKINRALIEHFTTRGKGTVIHSIPKMETTEEGDIAAVSRGIFSSPLSPEEIKPVLAEKLGIRSILPKGTEEGVNKFLRAL